MCGTCGCGSDSLVSIVNLQTGKAVPIEATGERKATH